MRKFNTMKIGEDVTFYALVESLQQRYTPNKSAYYSVGLSDGDTIVDARIWDVNLVEKANLTRGDIFFFEAHINEYASNFIVQLQLMKKR